MKRTVYLLIFFMAGMFFFTAGARYNWAGINGHEQAPADVKLVQSDIEQTQIQFSLDGYKETPLETPRGTQMVITVGEGVRIMEKGKPDLAKLVTTIIIPDMDDMEVNVTGYEYREFTGIEVAPSKGHFDRSINPDDVPFTYGEVYEKDAFWPGKLAQLEEPFIMRDFRGQTVTIFTFHYNPVSNILRVYTDIEVEVTSTGKMGEDPLIRRRDEIVVEPEFGRIYERFFLNMEAAERSYPMLEGEEGSLLIICYDDFMEPMKPFVDWKRTVGRKTEIVPRSEAGNTFGEIKNYVEEYYNENEDFAYLLLIGDAPNQIPAGIGSYGDYSDNAYAILSGMYNDIFVGRFSAETVAHVETQVQRMIEYERDLDETDTWVNTGLGIARNEGAGMGHHGESDIQHMNFIRDTLLNFTYDEVHSCYDGPGYSTSAAIISGHINNGVSTINFCNHGSVSGWSVANYSIYHVNQLTNIGKMPYIVSVACVNGDFVGKFCFAESWLRATHGGEPTGAIGFMGSTINQPWQPPMCGQDEMVSILTEESIAHGSTIKRTYGGVSTNGSMFMIPQYGGQGIRTHETWVLFGDPTLMVRTDVPTPFEPEHPPEASTGDQSFTVTSIDDGATAALTIFDENDEVIILGTAVAENGTAEIIFDEPLKDAGIMTLAITGFNKATYINDNIEIYAGYTVTFEIEDEDGNDIENAIITFDGETYDPGEYVIEDLEEGTYEYTVEKDGFFTVEDEITVDKDITVGVTMIKTHVVTFAIMDEEGNDIENAIITFDGETYDPGEYVIEDVEEGTYEYTVEKDGFFTVEDEITVDKDITVDVTMIKAHVVTFAIMDEEGNDIENAIITFDGETYDPGEYVIEDVEEGEYEYMVEKEGFSTIEDEIMVDDDITVDVTMIKIYTVTFEIMDKEGNEIENAVITFDGETYDPGEYVIENVKAGTYEYMVEKEGFITAGDEVAVESDVDIEVVIVETHADMPDKAKLSVFPNPARDKFTVVSGEMIEQIRLINISGQVIKNITVDAPRYEINVSNISKGVYFMQVHTTNSIKTKRVQIVR